MEVFWPITVPSSETLCTAFVCVCCFYTNSCLCLFVALAIQIVFDADRHHWVCTCYSNGTVRLFNSAFNGSLSPSLENQLVMLYWLFMKDNKLHVANNLVQQQQGNTIIMWALFNSFSCPW